MERIGCLFEMKRLLPVSQKNGWLKFETSGELPIIFEESIVTSRLSTHPFKYAFFGKKKLRVQDLLVELSFGVSFEVFLCLALRPTARILLWIDSNDFLRSLKVSSAFACTYGRAVDPRRRAPAYTESKPWNITMFSKLRRFLFGFYKIVAKHKRFGKP